MHAHAWKPEWEQPHSALPVETVALARALIGCVLVSETDGVTAVARIVETEAYPPGDPASHAFKGERLRNKAMFREPHHAYVYLIYGTAFCFNVTSEAHGIGAGVLVRAAEPLYGLDIMRKRRGAACRDRDLCRGPGRLTQALGIDLRDDGLPLLRPGRLQLGDGSPAGEIGSSVRIGITKAAEASLRFYERANPYVSGPRALSP